MSLARVLFEEGGSVAAHDREKESAQVEFGARHRHGRALSRYLALQVASALCAGAVAQGVGLLGAAYPVGAVLATGDQLRGLPLWVFREA